MQYRSEMVFVYFKSCGVTDRRVCDSPRSCFLRWDLIELLAEAGTIYESEKDRFLSR